MTTKNGKAIEKANDSVHSKSTAQTPKTSKTGKAAPIKHLNFLKKNDTFI